MLLAAVMTLSMVNFSWAEPAAEEPTITLGELLVKNYDGLKQGEKDLLESGLLNEAAYNFKAPDADNGDSLVEINADTKTVTAKTYTDGSFKWLPVSAQLKVGEVSQETIALAKGENDTYVGQFAYTGETYGITVAYEMKIEVAEDAQNKLLGAAAMLAEAKNASLKAKEGVETLDSSLQLKIGFGKDANENNSGTNLVPTPVWKVLYTFNQKGGNGLPFYIDENGSEPLPNSRVKWTTGTEEDWVRVNDLTTDAEDGRLDVMDMWTVGGKAANVLALTKYYEDVKAQLETTLAQAASMNVEVTTVNNATGNRLGTAVESTMNSIISNIQAGVSFSWSALNGLVKSTASAATLEKLVDNVTATSKTTADKTALLADTTYVTANVAQATVDVVVKAEVYKDGAVAADYLAEEAATVRLAAGAKKGDIEKLVEDKGYAANVLKLDNWADCNVGADYYDVNVTVSPEIDANVGLVNGQKYTYTITYTPKMYSVSAVGCEDILSQLKDGKLPYGFTLTLPAMPGEGKVWDYTVNGNAMDQGKTVRITGDTVISRAEGKAWEIHNKGVIIANNYAPDDVAAAAILKLNALNIDSVRLRTPEETDKLLTVEANEGSGYTVTAKSYLADGAALYWIPTTATPVTGETAGDPVPFGEPVADGQYTAQISNEFDTVKVNYKLQLSWEAMGLTKEAAVEMLNLPYDLVQEAKNQLEGLNKLAGQYARLGEVNSKLSMIKSVITDTKQGMTQESVDAINFIWDNCRDSATGNLFIYTYVGSYKDLNDAGKLTYYYQNQSIFKKQLDYLYENLLPISEDPALERVLKSAGYGNYVDRINEVKDTMKETVELLGSFNESISADARPGDLKVLAETLLENQEKVKQYTAEGVEQPPMLSEVLSVAGIGRKNVTVQVIVKNSNGTVKETQSVSVVFNNTDDEGVQLNAEDIAKLEAALASAETAAAVDRVHYNKASESGKIPAAGDKLTAAFTKVTVIYEPKQYTVKFEDKQGESVGDERFYYDNPVISLPASPDSKIRFDYSIGGTVLATTSGTYTFNTGATGAMAFDTLFANGSCIITRTAVDIAREKFMAMVDGMNKAVASGEGMTVPVGGKANCLRVAFIPYEKNGEITLVVRVAPSPSMKPESSLGDIATELLKYDSILMGSNGQTFLGDNKIDLQPVADVLLSSGLSLNTIINGITETGDIVESAVPGDVMWTVDASNGYAVAGGYVNELDKIGLQLLQSDMELDGMKISLAVTLEDFDRTPDDLKKVRDAAKTVADKGISVSLENGSVNVNASSNNAYKVLMGAALLLNQADVRNLDDSDWNLKNIIPDLYESILKPIFESETSTTTTIQNTLDKFGVDSVDVTKYQNAFKLVKAVLKNSEFTNESGTDTSFGVDMKYSMKELLDGISNEGLRDIVTNKLRSTDVSGSLKIGITHSEEYAAVLASAQKGNAGFKFIPAAANSSFTVTTGNTVVVLLADTCKKITVKPGCSNVVIDLNGHSVDKVISDEADRVIVVNSVLSKGVLADAGNATDGAALAKKLYTVDRAASANGENIVISLIPSVDAWKDLVKTRRNVLALAAEIAAEMAMNYGNATKKVSVNIDGQDYVLYDLALTDIATMVETASVADTGNILLDCLNLDGINALANDMIRKLTDFEAVSKAVEDGTDIISYTVTATGFGIEASVAEGDYLNISTKDGTKDTASVSIRVVKGEQYSDAIDRLQGILGVLKETVTVDDSTAVNIRDIAVAGTGDDVRFNADVDVNLKAKLDVRDDINYVILPAMIVANSLPSGDALKAELVNGIKAYLDKEDKDALKAAVERVSSRQLVAALKALNGKPIFAAQAKQLGLNVTIDAVEAGKMSAYGDILYMIGRAADLANINGNSGTIAGLKTENYGSYQLKYENKEFHPSRSVRMITGTVNAVANIVLDADVFTEAEDIVVKGHDGRYIYKGNDLTDALAHINEDAAGVTLVLNKAQSLTDNVKVNVPLTVTGKTLTMGSYRFILMNKEAAVTMTGITAEMVESNDPALYVTVSGNTASLLQYAAKANGEYCKTLAEAVTKLNGSGTLNVLTNVSMTDNIAVTGTMTVTGAANIEQGGFAFVLKNKESKLVSDAALNVTTDLSGYEVETNGTTYTLRAKTPAVVDGGYLKLDTRPQGINANELQTALCKILNKSNASVTVEASGLTKEGLVRNGASATVTSANEIVKYTIIIMGDANCNGEIDAGDGVLMRKHFQGVKLMDGVALLAADTNQTGEIDAGDGVRNRMKFQKWPAFSTINAKDVYRVD